MNNKQPVYLRPQSDVIWLQGKDRLLSDSDVGGSSQINGWTNDNDVDEDLEI